MFDPQYAGNVLLINNSRDALGIALLYLGYSVNTTDEAEIQEAYQLIADAVKNGVYQGKVMDEVFQKMEGGNAAIATYYAGDYLSMLENNEDLAYVVPGGGQQLVRGRHVRSQNLPAQGGGGGLDQLYGLH